MKKSAKIIAMCAAIATILVVAFADMRSSAVQEHNVSTQGRADELVIGNIISMDGKNIVYEAMTVKNGLIQYVGDRSTAERLCDDNTKVLDYGDNYIYPGFIDAHAHGDVAGPRLEFFADLSSGNSYEDYFSILEDYIREHPDKEYYYGAGWMEYSEPPNAQMLDKICSEKPIVLNSIDVHSTWMNTKAMEKFGVDEALAKKWGPDIVRVDSNGNPTGYISETPSLEITDKMSELTPEEWEKAMLAWQEFAFSKGITAYYEASSSEEDIKRIDKLIKDGRWKLRSYHGIMIDENEPDYVKCVQNVKKIADKYNNEYLQVTSVKIFIDGVLEAHTAWMLEEYDDDPGYYGIQRFCDHDRTVELYKEASKLGLSVHQHTIGDGAAKFALDCIEEAELETGDMDMRNAMAHLQFVSENDKKRMGELNVIGVVAPLWACKEEGYIEQSESYVGVERNNKSYPVRSLRDNGVVLACHTDYPVSTTISFPETIFMACNRRGSYQDESGILGPEEVISREDALAAITTGPAYSVRMEDHLGKLEVGYVANFCIYDSDFLHDDFDSVAAAKLLATVVDGEVVYSGE